jgi:hypothetical protein
VFAKVSVCLVYFVQLFVAGYQRSQVSCLEVARDLSLMLRVRPRALQDASARDSARDSAHVVEDLRSTYRQVEESMIVRKALVVRRKSLVPTLTSTVDFEAVVLGVMKV